MQLDQNRIVIRERGWLDLLDLGLCVTRAYAGPLLLALVVGVLPAMLLNAWLLAGELDLNIDGPYPQGYMFWIPQGYMFWMLVLVIAEIPLVTAPATLYLGEVVFLERPRAGGIARAYVRALPQLFLYQVLLRGLFVPLVATMFIPCSLWPYLSEVVLLERNPLRRRRAQMSTWRRVRALHGGSGGDLFARWLAAIAFGAILFFALWISMQYGALLLLNEKLWGAAAFTVLYPLALWIVVGYFTVVRFLGYLDLRIRREGWEVELMMRAEGARLARQLT
jgi:hypothetical protein